MVNFGSLLTEALVVLLASVSAEYCLNLIIYFKQFAGKNDGLYRQMVVAK